MKRQRQRIRQSLINMKHASTRARMWICMRGFVCASSCLRIELNVGHAVKQCRAGLRVEVGLHTNKCARPSASAHSCERAKCARARECAAVDVRRKNFVGFCRLSFPRRHRSMGVREMAKPRTRNRLRSAARGAHVGVDVRQLRKGHGL